MSGDLGDVASDAASQLAKAAYEDVAQPAARRIGVALSAVVKVALTPVSLMDWGYEQSKEWLAAKVDERLAKIPEERIVAPKLAIAVPVVNHIAMSVDSPDHRELYAELLLKSLDSKTQSQVHPSYVYIIEQLSPVEARLIALLAEIDDDFLFTETWTDGSHNNTRTIEAQFASFCKERGLSASDRAVFFLDNLLRLRLLTIDSWTDSKFYPAGHDRHGDYPAQLRSEVTRQLLFTDFGSDFIAACRPDDEESWEANYADLEEQEEED